MLQTHPRREGHHHRLGRAHHGRADARGRSRGRARSRREDLRRRTEGGTIRRPRRSRSTSAQDAVPDAAARRHRRGLRRLPGAVRRLHGRQGRRGRGRDRRQRRGQDHAAARDLRAAAADRRHHGDGRAATLSRRRRTRSSRPASPTCRKAGGCSRASACEDNLRMGAFMPGARASFSERLDYVYELFPRLRERENQLAGTLSGGEQQMCAIAPRADERPEAGAAGRAVDGARPGDRRAGVRPGAAHPRRKATPC